MARSMSDTLIGLLAVMGYFSLVIRLHVLRSRSRRDLHKAYANARHGI